MAFSKNMFQKSLIFLFVFSIAFLGTAGSFASSTDADMESMMIHHKKVPEERSSDYPNEKNTKDIYDQCVIKSVKNGDDWPTTQDKCDGQIGNAWCVDLKLPPPQDLASVLRHDPIDDQCQQAMTRESGKIIMNYGTNIQKAMWEQASKPSSQEGN